MAYKFRNSKSLGSVLLHQSNNNHSFPNCKSTMKVFAYITISVLALMVAVSMPTTNAQDDPDEIALAVLRSFLKSSEYVHKVLFQLLGYKMVYTPVDIPEPMHFDDFTFEHVWGGWYQEGTSRTFDPLLHGFNQSTFTIYPVVGEDYGVRIHLFIPVANLTGTYETDFVEFGFFTPNVHYTGNGVYEHVFHDVHLWIDLVVGMTVDGSRVVAEDVHSTLEFSRCELWAENFRTDGVPWTEAKWISQSAQYKVNHHEQEAERDILLSETVSSYLAMFWGILNVNRDDAYQGLIQSGEQPVTRKPLSSF